MGDSGDEGGFDGGEEEVEEVIEVRIGNLVDYIVIICESLFTKLLVSNYL